MARDLDFITPRGGTSTHTRGTNTVFESDLVRDPMSGKGKLHIGNDDRLTVLLVEFFEAHISCSRSSAPIRSLVVGRLVGLRNVQTQPTELTDENGTLGGHSLRQFPLATDSPQSGRCDGSGRFSINPLDSGSLMQPILCLSLGRFL